MGVKRIFKFIAYRALEVGVIVGLILFMPNLPPKASISESYRLPPLKSLTGKLAVNDKLNNVEIWHKGDLKGPECIVDYNGELYTGIQSGDIVKLVGKDHIVPVVKFGRPCGGYYEEKLCGRPLGLKFDKKGNLYAADAYYGIWKVDIKTGKKELLVSPEEEIDGKVPKVFNSIALASNGDIYFSHSSTEFDLENGLFDTLVDPSGRLIRFDPKTKTKTVVIDKLAFANGVIFSDDEEFILVTETVKSRILRYYVKGPKKGTQDVFVEGLPGLTDNLSSDGKGGFLVPLVMSADEDHPMLNQVLTPFPLIRKFLARSMGIGEWIFETIDRYYPNEFAKKCTYFIGNFGSMPKILDNKRVTLIRLSRDGVILDSLHSMNKKISHICDAHIFKDTLYLGSFSNDYIAKVPLSEIGWEDLGTDRAKREAKSEEKRQTPTAAPRVQKVTPNIPKKEPITQKENVQPQKQTQPTNQQTPVKQTTPPPTVKKSTTPTPIQEQAVPPKQKQQRKTPQPIKETISPKQEGQKQELPPKAQAHPTKQETHNQAPPPKSQTNPPKQESQKQTPSLKVQTHPSKQDSQSQAPSPKSQTNPPKQDSSTKAQNQPPKKEQVRVKSDTSATPQKQQTGTPQAQKEQAATQKVKQEQTTPQQVKKEQAAPQPVRKDQTTSQQVKKEQAATPQVKKEHAAPQQINTEQATPKVKKNETPPKKPETTTQQQTDTPPKEASPTKQTPPTKQAPPLNEPVKEQVKSVPLKDASTK